MGRREAMPVYRTVDGGHPAPYPDMTDEQLYNYEVAFNIPHRTFSHPPGKNAAASIVQQAILERGWPQARPGHQSSHQSSKPPNLQSDRLRRNQAFDAPRYTARKGGQETAKSGPIDFSKPVRTITTKQPVDIITTRARHPVYKVHAYIGDNDVVSVFTLDGRLSENGPQFLENVPQPRRLHLNIYDGPDGAARYRITQHASRDEAEAAAEPGRLTCVEVKVES